MSEFLRRFARQFSELNKDNLRSPRRAVQR
jgi:hypothetical protein